MRAESIGTMRLFSRHIFYIGLKVVSGNFSDGHYLPELEANFISGRLYLKDLGYYSLTHLRKISDAGGYNSNHYIDF